MTKEQLEHFITILRAWHEGKRLQCQDSGGKWYDRMDPTIPGPIGTYRIKPEKEKFVVYKYKLDQKTYIMREEYWMRWKRRWEHYEFIKEIEIEV